MTPRDRFLPSSAPPVPLGRSAPTRARGDRHSEDARAARASAGYSRWWGAPAGRCRRRRQARRRRRRAARARSGRHRAAVRRRLRRGRGGRGRRRARPSSRPRGCSWGRARARTRRRMRARTGGRAQRARGGLPRERSLVAPVRVHTYIAYIHIRIYIYNMFGGVYGTARQNLAVPQRRRPHGDLARSFRRRVTANCGRPRDVRPAHPAAAAAERVPRHVPHKLGPQKRGRRLRAHARGGVGVAWAPIGASRVPANRRWVMVGLAPRAVRAARRRSRRILV